MKKTIAVVTVMGLVLGLGAVAQATPVPGGLLLWLDGNDLDADGISEGLSEAGQTGGVVTTWVDKAPASTMTASQTNASYQPQLSVGALGGNDVVAFTGNDSMGVVNSPTGYQTTFIVYQDTADSNKDWTTPIGADIGGGGVFHGNDHDGAIFHPGWTHANTRNGDNYRNGADIGDGTSTSRPDAYAIDLHVATTTMNYAIQNIGADDCCLPNREIVGGIAEIIMYDRSLSFAERNQVGNYLEGKWGITWTDIVPPPEGFDAIAHRWSFNDGTMNDSIGAAHGTPENGNVTVSGNELQITGTGRMLTAQIGNSIGEKTLVVWTTLDNPAFRSAGSALTIENDAGGATFDGIVYAERQDRRWMAGSDFFRRTRDVSGPGAIDETSTEEVMMAIVYAADNSVALYRNGVQYGNSYVWGTLVNYNANAVVQIGRRHGTNGSTYIGSINEARIYADALSADDIQTLFQLGPNQLVPEPSAFLLAAMGLLGLAPGALVRRRRKGSQE